MIEGKRYASDLPKAVTLPYSDRRRIGAYDEIELHGAKAACLGSDQGMLQHPASDTSPRGDHPCHVTTAGDVTAPAT